ncbi:MAG: hypothetical protein KAH20_07110 [Methylococcales bacterium]|nr:hypothetical protein [Methylococcales bacterium]
MKTVRGLMVGNKNHAELYQKIVDFPLDNPNVRFPLSSRLAIENVWSLDYTQRVIHEYKRFLFLMIVVGHKVAPSDQVDQVWHLHMLSSYSYWEDFCVNTVGKQLHHWPAEGCSEFYDWYGMTIDSYTQYFGHQPPENIWIDPAVRLKTKTHFIRVNKEESWVVPKCILMMYVKYTFKRIGFAYRFKYKLLHSHYFKNTLA